MTESVFARSWIIRSSTSRFFPLRSDVEVKPKEPISDGFELNVIRQGHPEKIIDREFREVASGRALQGRFERPGENPQDPPERFEIVVTLSPVDGPDGKQRLLGLVLAIQRRIEDEGTGVWVAEAKPPEPADLT